MQRALDRLLASLACFVFCAVLGSVALSSPAYGANNPPVLDPIGNQSVQRGAEMTITITGSDPDADPLTITSTGTPAYAFFEDLGVGIAYLTLMPPANEPPSVIPMTMTISDGLASTSETFSIRIYPAGNPNPPSISTIGNQTVAEGQTGNATVSATDPDNQVLSLTSSLPAFASLTSTGSAPGSASARLDLAPGYCAAGSYAASVTVSDGDWTSTESFTINVTDVNRGPAWGAPGGYTMTVNEGSSANLSVAASDPDQQCGAAAPLLSLSAGASPSLTVTLTAQGGGSGLLHVAASYDAAGTHQLTLRASDAMNPSLTADVSVQVTVQAVNRAPVASAGGPYTGVMGVPVNMSGTGSSDPDGDGLSYAWAFGDGWTGSGPATSHAYASGGTYNVCVTVTDNGTPNLSDTKCTTATVQSVNRAPVAASSGPYTGFASVPVTMSSAGSMDPDGDLFSCAWAFGDGGTGSGATPSHAYAAAGTYQVSLTVTDTGTPSMSDTSHTTATVTTLRPTTFAARITCKNSIQLSTDGQYHVFKIEPAGGCFAPRDVNLATIVMKNGALQSSAATAFMSRDTDRNGVAEVQAYFTAAALRAGFAAAPYGKSNVTVALEGALTTGGKFRGEVSFQIKKDNDGGGQNVSVAPNPLNPQATLRFFMSQPGSARVRLYDSSGRVVRTLMDQSDAAAGYHNLTIDGRTSSGGKLASGVYFYRVETVAGLVRGQFVIMK